jgi:hypothetical protein
MKAKIIIKIFKIFDLTFIIASIAMLIFSIIYYSNNNDIGRLVEEIMGFFYRIVTALFFYTFAIFVEEWLNVE